MVVGEANINLDYPILAELDYNLTHPKFICVFS